jgi:hypothetical protein
VTRADICKQHRCVFSLRYRPMTNTVLYRHRDPYTDKTDETEVPQEIAGGLQQEAWCQEWLDQVAHSE